MCGVGDAGGFDDAETVIAGRGEPAPGVDADPDPDVDRGKEAPAKDRCASAAACTASRARRKVKKSASPWRSTWCPPRPPNASASSRSCSARSLGISAIEPTLRKCRSLDVREQEGDRSGRCMYRYRAARRRTSSSNSVRRRRGRGRSLVSGGSRVRRCSRPRGCPRGGDLLQRLLHADGAIGGLNDPGLDQHAPELREEERVPPRELVQPRVRSSPYPRRPLLLRR